MKLIIGGSGGVGQGLLSAWQGHQCFATYYRSVTATENTERVHWLHCDIEQPGWAEALLDAVPLEQLETLVLSTGILHEQGQAPEKSIRQFKRDWFLRSMALNAVPCAELLAELQARLPRKSELRVGVLSAKVGSISDNRLGGWYSYRASKAALNMLIRSTAIEWSRCLPAVSLVALHPGTTDSALSAPFQDRLPKGQLHNSTQTGQALAGILDSLTTEQSGHFISWDGSLLPW